MAGHPVDDELTPSETARLLTGGSGGEAAEGHRFGHGAPCAAINVPASPPDGAPTGPGGTGASLSTADALQGQQAGYALRYVDPQDAGRSLDVRVPDEWLRALSPDQTALVNAVMARPSDEGRGLHLRGGAQDGWRLGYTVPVVLPGGRNASCRVQALVSMGRDGRQQLQRLTLTQHAPDGTVASRVSLPPPPAHFRCAALDVAVRAAPVGVDSDPLPLHAVSTNDQRQPRLVQRGEGERRITFVTGHPFVPIDVFVHIDTTTRGGVEQVSGVALHPLPEATQRWLTSRVYGAPHLEQEVAEMLLAALLDPSQFEAELGVSVSRGDRFIDFACDFQVTANGEGSPDLETWQLRADFHLNQGVWELGVLQFVKPDGVRQTVYAPDRPEDGFVNMRTPRGRPLGSPPSSAGRSEVSTSSRRSREEDPLQSSQWQRTVRPRVESPTGALLEGVQGLEVRLPPVPGDGALPPPARPADPALVANSPVRDALVSQDEYRAGLAEGQGVAYARAGVCGAIAAGVMVGRVLPFDRVLAVAADPLGGMTMAEARTLLANEGVPTGPLHYPPGVGWTPMELGSDLQQWLDGGAFDRAEVCYRLDAAREHFVAIWRQDGRWLLHDGVGQPPVLVLPAGAEGAWMAHHLFGSAPQEIAFAREMELALVRSNALGGVTGDDGGSSGPAPREGGRPARGTAPAQEASLGPPSRERVPYTFTERLDGRGYRRLSDIYESDGLLNAWRHRTIGGVDHQARLDLANAVYPHRDRGQRIDEGDPIYRYDAIPFAGRQVSVLVRYADDSRSVVVNVAPLSTAYDQRQVRDTMG